MLKTIARTAAAASLMAFPLAACGGGGSTGGADAANADLKVHALDAHMAATSSSPTSTTVRCSTTC